MERKSFQDMSCPVALALAARALKRGEAGAGGVLICASSNQGERGAACLVPVTS